MTALTVRVPGVPVPQGSLRNAGPGRTFHSNDATLRPWRASVIAHVQEQMAAGGEWPLAGPVSVSLTFSLPRPKSAPKSRLWPDRKPDLDKLVRAANDSLQAAGAIYQDAQIVHSEELKAYGVPGMVLTLRPLGADVAARFEEQTA